MNKNLFREALSLAAEQDPDAVSDGKKHDFSPRFEQKMDRLIRSERKPLWRYVNSFGKRLALALLMLAVCLGGVITVSADAREYIFRMLKVPEDPPENARTEYRYPFTSSDTVEKIMEQFLQQYTGSEAEYFVQEGPMDWCFIYRDVWTDCAYTAMAEGDELRIFDNSGGADPAKIRQRIDRFFKKHSEEDNAARQERLKADFLATLTGTAESIDILLYYSARDGRFYDCLSYVAVDDSGAYFADGIMYPIP